MAGEVLDIHPVTRITINTQGKPGQRKFLLQVQSISETITLKIEKEQARVLSVSLIDFLDEINQKHPQPYTRLDIPPRSAMALHEPAEPLFAVGQIGLGYDEEDDLIVLVAQELQAEEFEEPMTIRFWANRGQMRALSDHTLEVVEQGRPLCPLCNHPKSENQFCPRSNGHESFGSEPCPT